MSHATHAPAAEPSLNDPLTIHGTIRKRPVTRISKPRAQSSPTASQLVPEIQKPLTYSGHKNGRNPKPETPRNDSAAKPEGTRNRNIHKNDIFLPSENFHLPHIGQQDVFNSNFSAYFLKAVLTLGPRNEIRRN